MAETEKLSDCTRPPDWPAMELADVVEGVARGLPGAREEYARRQGS